MVREHDAVNDLIPALDLAHSIFNVVTGIPVADERDEIRAFRPLAQWRDIIESVGLSDSYLYEMEKGDPTYDEMMCFYKGDLRNRATRSDTPHPDKVRPLSLNRTNTMAFYENSEEKVEALFKNMPFIAHETAKNLVTKTLDVLTRLSHGIKAKEFGLTAGQAMVVDQLASRLLDPAIEVLRVTKPYLEEAKPTEGDFDVIPNELVILVHGLLKKAEEGSATPPELLLAGFFKDVKGFFQSGDRKTVDEVPEKSDFTRAHVEKAVGRIMTVLPALQDLNNLAHSDFSGTAKLFIESNMSVKGSKLDAKTVTDSLYPYLDQYSWSRIEPALEEIIQDPENNKFLYSNLTNPRSPWHRAAMGLLSSREVKFNGFGRTMASAAGLDALIDMYKVARRIRREEDLGGQKEEPISLSTKTSSMLRTATDLMINDVDNQEAATESMMRCLRLAGLMKRKGPEFTWFKMVEWLQVEFIEIFGASLHTVPWYRFPFTQMMQEYFYLLFQEVKVVQEKHGLAKALLSKAFFTDLIPGIVMSVIFGQLLLLSLPLKAVLGNEYSEDQQKTQFEELVLVSKNGWQDFNGINGTRIVDNLYLLKVPSLGSFTSSVLEIALGVDRESKLMSISGNEEVQMKVFSDAGVADRMKHQLTALKGVKVMFDYELPATGTQSDGCKNFCLCVKVENLLDVIRELDTWPDVEIQQIYDFWH